MRLGETTLIDDVVDIWYGAWKSETPFVISAKRGVLRHEIPPASELIIPQLDSNSTPLQFDTPPGAKTVTSSKFKISMVVEYRN